MKRLLILAVLLLPYTAADARSQAARAEFQRLHPCPETGRRRGPCPGWVVDHITPLCAGGLDRAPNMQWQTVTVSRVKDVQERESCRKLRE